MKKVTIGDIARGGGAKIWHFWGDVIFEWPLFLQYAPSQMLALSSEYVFVFLWTASAYFKPE